MVKIVNEIVTIDLLSVKSLINVRNHFLSNTAVTISTMMSAAATGRRASRTRTLFCALKLRADTKSNKSNDNKDNQNINRTHTDTPQFVNYGILYPHYMLAYAES
jgi:hypothetical protein